MKIIYFRSGHRSYLSVDIKIQIIDKFFKAYSSVQDPEDP
jgi:hypothetical protein